MGWDDPISSHLLTKHQFFWGGTTPPRPTLSQILSSHVVGRSHLPTLPRTLSFHGWDDPTSSYLFTKPQFRCGAVIPPRPTVLRSLSVHVVPPRKNWGGKIPPRPTFSQTTSIKGVGRSHLVPPSYKPSVFMGWDGPTSSHLLTNHQFLLGGTIPPRPTFLQILSFHVVGRSHIFQPCCESFSFHGVGYKSPPVK